GTDGGRRGQRLTAVSEAARKRVFAALALVLALLLPALPAVGQSEMPGAAATPLAAARLDSVTGMPLYLRLYRARLPPAAHASYEGANVLLYALSGAATLEVEGGATQPVGEGRSAFIAAGQL